SEKIFLKIEAPLKAGDGIVFDAGRPDEKEEGGRVYAVERAADILSAEKRDRSNNAAKKDRPICRQDVGSTLAEVVLSFGRGDLDFSRIHVGDKVWKTSDPELDKELRQTFSGEQPH